MDATMRLSLPSHLCPLGAMHQGYDQQPYQGGCDEHQYCPHYPSQRVADCGDVVDGVGSDDGDGTDSMDNPNPSSKDYSNRSTNPYSSSSRMDYSRNIRSSHSGTEHPNHSTSRRMAQLPHPTSRTSRLYTLAPPKPYRPTPLRYRTLGRTPRRSGTHPNIATNSMTTAYDR